MHHNQASGAVLLSGKQLVRLPLPISLRHSLCSITSFTDASSAAKALLGNLEL